ncbi:type VI secretion system baseplate subunit TssK [Magnetospirillum sulfuroxidans]|uniref:Type VI secretion system baseplate subunit TssK n=1 Tax=Magnetospirillum sulfuroxidans TaxID=611300 RepID=A0ABS5IC44_9PROT|nr:type VI secretion system baseplate subunit TssK [Magnetospirillum sulfuroxidans]MBR9971999.1 type VI secretion system baseplate subunit TssK [Magnetospirillum sulfuroxidans]
MAELSEIPEAVQWHEGMLLAPQHFQQAWLRNEAMLGYAVGHAGLFPWGVRQLVIDRGQLAQGKLRLLALEAVMPDGLAILHPRDDEPLLELDLTTAKNDLVQATMAVHLSIPLENARPEPGETRRWRSVEGRAVADTNSRDNEIPVPRLRPALSLALTDSPLTPPPRRFVSMPIARVGFRDDAFSLEPFAPPRTDFPATSDLAVLIGTVVQRLREKASGIADRLQATPGASADLPGGAQLDALRAMVAILPRMEGLLQAERIHPFLIYLALCDMMGSLSWMGGQPVPPSPPPYHHNDCLPAFVTIVQFLLRMMERIRESYRTLRFKRSGDNAYSLLVSPEMLAPGTLVVGVRAAPGASPAETTEWLRKALIGSRSMMKTIGSRRVRGAPRQRIETADELKLLPPAGMVLFRVTVDPAFVLADQILELIGPADSSEPQEILLFTADTAVEKPPAPKPPKPAAASEAAPAPKPK